MRLRSGDSYPVGQRGGRLKKDSLRFIVPFFIQNPSKAIDSRTLPHFWIATREVKRLKTARCLGGESPDF